MIKYISIRKIINLLKIYIGYALSAIFKKPFAFGLPASLTIEPTNSCNLRCPECPTGNNISGREKGLIEFVLYKKVIDELKEYIIYQMLYFQGEPFLHPDIFEMIKYADNHKIYTSLSTNGQFLNSANNSKIIKSGLKTLLVSVDGTSQDTYEKYRVGGDLNIVLSGIRDLVFKKKKVKSKYPKIVMQFLVLKSNQHQIKEAINLSKHLGVNKLEFKSAQIDTFNKTNLIPTIDRFSRYKRIGNDFRIKNKLRNYCFRIWSTCVITWDGTIVPCCFDKRNQYPMGITTNAEIKEHWKSSTFNQFRHNILRNRKETSICCNCTEGLDIRC